MKLNPTSPLTNTRPAGFIGKNDLARGYNLTLKTLMKKVKAKGLDLGRKKLLSPGEVTQILDFMGGEPDWNEVKVVKGIIL